jgi:O-antigen ligase
MNYIKKNNFVLYFFFIFPFLFVSGPFLPDLFICLVSIFFLIFFSKNIKKFFYKSYYLYFLFLFYFYINFTSLIGYNSNYSLQSSIPYIRFILFSLIFSYLLIKINYLRRLVVFSFLITYVLLLTDSFVQLTIGKNIIGYSLVGNRISSLFGDWLVMGSFVARTLPIVLGITFLEEIKYKNILQICILIVSGILIIMSSERLAFVYFIITLCTFIFFKINKKNIFAIILLIILIFSSIFYLRPAAYDRLFVHTFNQLKSAEHVFFFSYRHQLHYITALNQFKDSKIFGHGVKSFRLICDNPKYAPIDKIINDNKINSPINGYLFIIINHETDPVNGKSNDVKYLIIKNQKIQPTSVDDTDITYKLRIYGELIKIYVSTGEFVEKNRPLVSMYEFANGCNTHPHNVHLQFLAETGIVGYLFLIIAFFFIIYQLFLIIKKKFLFIYISKKEYCIFYCLLGLFLSLFPLFPSGNFFNNWLTAIFYFNVANLISILPLKKL